MEQKASLKSIDFEYYIHHYLRLFWRWKWYLFLAIPLSAALAVIAVLYLGLTNKPTLTATALIGVDKQSMQKSWDTDDMYLNKERLLLNRNFLENVVHRLSLQLIIPGYSRYDIFDSVKVDSSTLTGSYNFEIDKSIPDIFRIRFSNSQMNIKNQIIEMGSISNLKTINFSGIHLFFSKSFLLYPHPFSLSIRPIRASVDNILSHFKVTSPNPREQTYYFSILLEGTDYPLITQTANTIADMFVECNLSWKRRRMKETLVVLEKQLEVAENQLSKSKEDLKSFLSANPDVGLSQSTQMVMNELIRLETGSMENIDLAQQANELKNKLSGSPLQETEQILSEVVAFLQSQGNLSAASLQLSLTQQQEQKRNASGNYDRNHPVFKEIDKKLSDLKFQAIQALDSYIFQLKKLQSDKNQSRTRIASRLHSIPSKELQLAELQKRQEINSEIYSSLLVKFNEATVAQTVQKSDVFVMDYAVQPIPHSPLKQQINALLFILFLILTLSLGPALIFDLFDKTARTEQELRKMVPYNFLITLPVFSYLKKSNLTVGHDKAKSQKNHKRKKELLLNEPKNVHPSHSIELFRSLVTKIQLNLFNEVDKSLAVLSLNAEEGKSTVAANLALSIAEHGLSTILVDCDLRKGKSHQFFDLPDSPGLSDYLSNSLHCNQISSSSIPIQQTGIANLWLISSGHPIDNPQKYLNSTAMVALKQKLVQRPFFLVFDCPPIGITTDAALLNNIVSRFILVIRAGFTNTVNACKIIQKDYPVIDSKLLGVVLNMGENVNLSRYYKYY